MLRRSTGLSEEMKRVGTSRGNVWASGSVKCKWVASARLSIPLLDSGGSDELVTIGGLLEAIERRRLVSGSANEFAIVRCLMKIDEKPKNAIWI